MCAKILRRTQPFLSSPRKTSPLSAETFSPSSSTACVCNFARRCPYALPTRRNQERLPASLKILLPSRSSGRPSCVFTSQRLHQSVPETHRVRRAHAKANHLPDSECRPLTFQSQMLWVVETLIKPLMMVWIGTRRKIARPNSASTMFSDACLNIWSSKVVQTETASFFFFFENRVLDVILKSAPLEDARV